jgi:N-acetylneuraminic acid mutarotase
LWWDVGYCRSEYYNSLTKLSIQLNSARTEEALPEGRAFHNMVTYGNKIILYGGHNSSILQNYYSFNVSEEKWVAVPHISGHYPDKVEKQSCVLFDMLLVFFGGYYCSHDFEYEACYNSIFVLDIENMRWVDQIEVHGQKPPGRFAHTAALIDSDMYVFGGIHNSAENIYLNDIWRINLSRVNELSWVELKPRGRRPSPRHGHTMNALHNYLVVFGGHSEKGDFLNDVFIYNTAEEEW